MKVGIIQSNYIPWRGYFDFIASVDLFVFHDDLQYTKGDWRNRNKIKTKNGLRWISVPVKYKHTEQLICDTEVDYSTNWQKSHINQFHAAYFRAPNYCDAHEILQNNFQQQPRTISELNISLVKDICEYLDIKTPLAMSSEYQPVGTKTERLLSILCNIGADTYVSGPSADGYLDKELLRKSSISVEYKRYDYPEYSQLHKSFNSNVTILDLIANCGKNCSDFLRNRAPNEVVIEGNNE